MINKLKIGLGLSVASICTLGLASVALATTAVLVYSDYTGIYLSGTGYTVTIKPNSNATSLIVGTSSFDVVVPTSNTFTLLSHQNITVSAAGGSAATSNSCSGTENTLVITGDDAVTYTLTPNSGVCNTNSGGGGGGGGGGSPAAPTATPAVPAVPATPAVPTVAPAVPATPAVPAVLASGAYSYATSGQYNLGTATLKNGSKGEPVKELQRLLNKVLVSNLAVDGKLGPKTIAIIKKWQKAHGLKADGLIGKLTKAAMKAEAEK